MKEFDGKCVQILEGLDSELQKIRTGRAHAGLLDNITVMVYGQPNLLKQVASVGVQDARTLSITPWDKSTLNAIAKAIQEADLGLNPNTMSDKVLVPMPALTEERRKDLIKIVRQEGERCKITLRHHRREVLSSIKSDVKNKVMTEDEEKRAEQEIDKIIEKYTKNVDVKVGTKEKELLSI